MTYDRIQNAALIDFLSAPQKPTLARVALAVAVTLTKWDTRRRTRRELSHLEDWQLHDIGLTLDDARIEAARPFWRM